MHTYQLVLVLDADETTLTCRTVVQLPDGTQSVPLQEWVMPTPTSTAARRDAIIGNAADHGWTLPDGRWPRFGKSALTLDATPRDWETILSQTKQTRDDITERLEAAWHAVIIDADLPVIKVGQLVGFTRARVYQLRKK